MKKIYVSPTVELYDFIGEEDMLTSSNPDSTPIAVGLHNNDPYNTDWDNISYVGELTGDEDGVDDVPEGGLSVPFTIF